MPPRVRAKAREKSHKVYKSKKVPQQARFPERKKTVRRSTAPVKDGSEKRQMKFLPDKMLVRTNTVQDSDDEEFSELEENPEKGVPARTPVVKVEEPEASTARGIKSQGKKRVSDVTRDSSDSGEEFAGPSEPPSKRRRISTPRTAQHRSTHMKAKPANDSTPSTSARLKSQDIKPAKRRRQSTMTQVVDGRVPLSDEDEPDFQPVRRNARRSSGKESKKEQEKKQQKTLTQMIPGLRSFEMLSDEDLTEEEDAQDDGRAGYDAIASHLASQGLIKRHGEENKDPVGGVSTRNQLLTESSEVVQSVEDATDEENEAEYHPTQFIDGPITRTRPVRRRTSEKPRSAPQIIEASSVRTKDSNRGEALLCTPKKRRDRVIPSSQSPGESPLITPFSTRIKPRSPLEEVSGNSAQSAKTPSKRKQVAFEDPNEEQRAPPSLRKFRSVIQDSEDEDDEILEWDMQDRGALGTNTLIQGKDIGAETQAILQQIDQACGSPDTDLVTQDEESPALSITSCRREQRRDVERSPELGLVQISQEQYEMQTSATARVKQEPVYDPPMAGVSEHKSTLERAQSESSQASIKAEDEDGNVSTPIASSPPLTPQIDPGASPSPIFIKDESPDQDSEHDLTPPQTSRKVEWQSRSTIEQHSEDLDGHPVQVPRSPSTEHETQHSHSSKAEQQLQNEWCSYSQYVSARPAHSSSMHVAPDKFSYTETPLPPRLAAPPQPFSHQYSQATTVDEVTPKKNRTQRFPHANTTPRHVASSQPFVSPIKPPPLFIPSSFPSPAKAQMEDWSSPINGVTQLTYGTSHVGGSIEDFSIPPPPPDDEE